MNVIHVDPDPQHCLDVNLHTINTTPTPILNSTSADLDNTVLNYCIGDVVAHWWWGGLLVTRWLIGDVVAHWWCGGSLVMWWLIGDVVAHWWCFGLLVMRWFSGGSLAMRWIIGDEVAHWWCCGLLVMRWLFGDVMAHWWCGGSLVMRWLICDEVAQWWKCGGSWGGKFEIIGSASLTMALGSGMVHREILLIKKRKQTNRFIFRLPLPPSLENKMFSVTCTKKI